MPRKIPKSRIDTLLVERDLATDLKRARALLMAGVVLVDDTPISKPGTQVAVTAAVRLKGALRSYVSRGGEKLEAALSAFSMDVRGAIAADLGASTGGFTDCLLQRGAVRVYAVDVGYGQLDWKLRNDSRVVVMERQNARNLTALPEPVTLVVGDLSFISLRLILPAIARISAPEADCVLLIKPQFEVARDAVETGGRVSDPNARREAIARVLLHARAAGFDMRGQHESPIRGAKSGNIEHLVHLLTPPGDRGRVGLGPPKTSGREREE